jgi:hypothetical protein
MPPRNHLHRTPQLEVVPQCANCELTGDVLRPSMVGEALCHHELLPDSGPDVLDQKGVIVLVVSPPI